MMLHTTHVRVRRGETLSLDDVSFSMMSGDLTVIVGASGSGKTTLLEVCAGLVTPDQGEVWVAGHKQSFWRKPQASVRRAYLSSEEPWTMHISALDVVSMGCQDKTLKMAARRARARQALACTGADAWQARTMPSLSTTQALRVRLARLLMQMWDTVPDGQSFVLMDTTLGAADQPTQQLVFNIAKSLAKRGAAVALVSHDYTRVLDEADRVVMLRAGEVVADGSAQDMLTAGRLAVILDVDAAVEHSPHTHRRVVLPRPPTAPWLLPF